MNAIYYRDNILIGIGPTFQQDNGQTHTAIDNIWDYLGQCISRRPQMNN